MRMRGGWVGWCWWGSWGLWMMMSWWWLQVCVVSALSGVIWGGLCGSFESISYATYLCLYILYSCYSYCDQPIVSLLVTSVITCTCIMVRHTTLLLLSSSIRSLFPLNS